MSWEQKLQQVSSETVFGDELVVFAFQNLHNRHLFVVDWMVEQAEHSGIPRIRPGIEPVVIGNHICFKLFFSSY